MTIASVMRALARIARIDELERKRSLAFELWAAGEMPDDLYESRMHELDAELMRARVDRGYAALAGAVFERGPDDAA